MLSSQKVSWHARWTPPGLVLNLVKEKVETMKRTNFQEMVAALLPAVEEIFPWDLQEELDSGKDILLLDVRCPLEFQAMHIRGSINVPRGVLELACDYGYEQTLPELVEARERRVVVVCRSGNRSVLAVHTMQLLGYRDVVSLKTGLRGWNDSEYPLVDMEGNQVPLEYADDYFLVRLRPEQVGPGA